jgi:hypothetical protein
MALNSRDWMDLLRLPERQKPQKPSEEQPK